MVDFIVSIIIAVLFFSAGWNFGIWWNTRRRGDKNPWQTKADQIELFRKAKLFLDKSEQSKK